MPASAPPTVGPYELLARVGEGGMGVVHLAVAPNGQQVAVKLLRPHVVGDEHGRSRMAREVTSLRRVRSPYVAEVYDADPWGDTPYLVTRYVPGPSLSARVDKRGPVVGAELHTLAHGLAEALVAVHSADVLHRDVKPGNVLLEGADPVLIDFGLAQLSDDSRLTHSGWLLGTPGYLAPEILYGGEPSEFADVHSWAATVVFAATGRGPYGNGPAIAVMDRVRRGEYDLSGVPDWLYWPVRSALLPDPRERPSARQLVQNLSGGALPPPRVQQSPTGATALIPNPTTAMPTAVTVTPRTPVGASVQPSPPPAFLPGRAPRGATGAFWLAALGLLVAVTVTAPVLAVVLLGVACWLLRTCSVRVDALARWRQRRGVRRNDSVLATVATPWFAAVAFPESFVNTLVAAGAAAVVVSGLTLLTQPDDLVLVLASGAVVAGLMSRWGPDGGRVRAGGRALTAATLGSWRKVLLVLGLLAVVAAAVLAVRQASGPSYSPLPDPPWEQHLRDLVPTGR